MKQKLLFAVFLLSCFFAWAQPAASYSISSSVDVPYQEIDDGTPIGTKLYNKNFDAKSIADNDTGFNVNACSSIIFVKGFNIGFPFNFCGQSFNKFTVNTRGLVYLGQDSIAPGFANSFLGNMCANAGNVISNLYSDSVKSLQTSASDPVFTQISYKTEGAVGSRILIVQFKNILIRTAANYFDTLNYQIRLYEGTNSSKIVYKKAVITAPTPLTNLNFGIGLKVTQSNLIILQTTSDWTKFTTSSNAYNKNTFTKAVYPPENLTYTFTTPLPCVASTTPTALKSSDLTSDGMKISFTKNEDANGYLVLQSTELVLTQNPENGKIYKKDSLLGNAKVIAYGETLNHTLTKLRPSTMYYYHIYSYNNMCTGPVTYSTETLTDSVKTLLGSPIIQRIKRDTNSVTLQTQANEIDDNIIVSISTNYKNTIVRPKGKLKVGDSLSEGVKIIYKGAASEFKVSNLTLGTRYWFCAWSVDATDTVYSTTYSHIGERTWDSLPAFYNFQGEVLYSKAAGWSNLINNPSQESAHYSVALTAMIDNGTYYYQTFPNASSQGESLSTDAITPEILLGSGKHRLLFGFAATTTGMLGDVGYKLQPEDSLLVQISDNGIDFKTLYVVNNKNYTLTAAAVQDRVIEIPDYENRPVNFRFVYYSPYRSKSAIAYLKVEQILPCDYVTQVMVIDSSITTNSANMQWLTNESSQEETISWNLSYKTEEATEWSSIQNVETNPGSIAELPAQTPLQVRVQAVCEDNQMSVWSDPSPVFHTKYELPIFENFVNKAWLNGTNSIPYWTGAKKVFTTDADITFSNLTGNTGAWKVDKWKQNNAEKAILTTFVANANDWFFTPVFDLGEEQADLLLSYDFALAPRWVAGSLDSVNGKSRFLTVISTDGGKTYSNANILKSYGAGSENKLGNLDSIHETFLLKGQKGKIQIGFYVENKGTASANSCIFLDNISLEYSCPNASDLQTQKIGEDSAVLTWISSDKANAWLLRYRAKDEENYTYNENPITKENDILSYTLHNLHPETTYEWGVLSFCAADDSSRWTKAEFTTALPYVCDTVLNSRVIRSGRYEMTIGWQANAQAYKFEYRKLNTSEWISSMVDSTFVPIPNLLPGTTYEYRIQSQCTADATDVSLWTSIKRFTTQYLTCPAPENFHTIKPTYESVTLVWKSDARQIGILVRKTADASWGDELNTSARDTIELAGLDANTTYWIRIKMVCAPGDESTWSDSVQVSTTNYPACNAPTNLEARSITNNSVQLTWTAEYGPEYGIATYNILLKKSTASRYDTTSAHIGTTYTVKNLTANTAYTWKVQTQCAQYIVSRFSESHDFSTLPISIEINKDAKKDFTVYSQNGQIHILNPQNRNIEKVQILSVDGKQIGIYQINSSDNIFIPTEFQNTMVLIRLYTAKGVFIYKNYIN